MGGTFRSLEEKVLLLHGLANLRCLREVLPLKLKIDVYNIAPWSGRNTLKICRKLRVKQIQNYGMHTSLSRPSMTSSAE